MQIYYDYIYIYRHDAPHKTHHNAAFTDINRAWDFGLYFERVIWKQIKKNNFGASNTWDITKRP